MGSPLPSHGTYSQVLRGQKLLPWELSRLGLDQFVLVQIGFHSVMVLLFQRRHEVRALTPLASPQRVAPWAGTCREMGRPWVGLSRVSGQNAPGSWPPWRWKGKCQSTSLRNLVPNDHFHDHRWEQIQQDAIEWSLLVTALKMFFSLKSRPCQPVSLQITIKPLHKHRHYRGYKTVYYRLIFLMKFTVCKWKDSIKR